MTSLPGRRRYRRPPLQEAIIEFTFAGGDVADWTLAGRMFDVLRAEYDGEQQSGASISVTVPQAPSVAAQPLAQGAVQVGCDLRLLCFDQNKTRALTLTSTLLGVHRTSSYDGWSEFAAQARRALDARRQVSGGLAIMSVSVHFRNGFSIPASDIVLSDYVNVGPQIPESMPAGPCAAFQVSTTYVKDAHTAVGVSLALVGGTASETQFALNISGRWQNNTEPAEVETTDIHISELKRLVTATFEAAITDRLRTSFEPIEESSDADR